MPSRNKYGPDINWEDVSTYVRDHEKETGYRAVIMLTPGRAAGGGTKIEVRLVQSNQPDTAPTSLVIWTPFPDRQIARQMSAILHAVAQAYAMLDQNPWLWTAEARAKARGDVE